MKRFEKEDKMPADNERFGAMVEVLLRLNSMNDLLNFPLR